MPGPRPPAALVVAVLALGAAACGAPPADAPRDGSAAPARATPTLHAVDRRHPSPDDQRDAVAHYARAGVPVYCGARHGDAVALTFDDGPGPYTPIVLRELRRAGMEATFFLVGASVRRYPAWPARERALGAIGDHTMTHPNLRALPLAQAVAEIEAGRAAVLAAAGAPVDLFRPPYGRHSDAVDRHVASAGMAEILWDVDSEDSRRAAPADFHEIAANVRRAIRPGSIVLLHENRGQTVRALRSILPALARRGLRSVTVPELLAADPPTRAQLDAGARGCEQASR